MESEPIPPVSVRERVRYDLNIFVQSEFPLLSCDMKIEFFDKTSGETVISFIVEIEIV